MIEQKGHSAEWYLLALGSAADVIGVITWVGLDVSQRTKFITVAVLAGMGVLASACTLVSAVICFFLVKGSFFSGAYHVRRFAASLAVLVASGAIAAVLILNTKP